MMQVKLGADAVLNGVLHVKGELVLVEDAYVLDVGDVVVARFDVVKLKAERAAKLDAVEKAKKPKPTPIEEKPKEPKDGGRG